MEKVIKVENTEELSLDVGVRLVFTLFDSDYHVEMATSAAYMGSWVGAGGPDHRVDVYNVEDDGEFQFMVHDATIPRPLAFRLVVLINEANCELPEDGDMYDSAEYLGGSQWELSS